ncbi:MAG: hypothetical protein JWL77_7121, partial [Chthonomonadaceae bacterium]|nr:hypothetical protein [Chthonomonadaceae bacterium]
PLIPSSGVPGYIQTQLKPHPHTILTRRDLDAVMTSIQSHVDTLLRAITAAISQLPARNTFPSPSKPRVTAYTTTSNSTTQPTSSAAPLNSTPSSNTNPASPIAVDEVAPDLVDRIDSASAGPHNRVASGSARKRSLTREIYGLSSGTTSPAPPFRSRSAGGDASTSSRTSSKRVRQTVEEILNSCDDEAVGPVTLTLNRLVDSVAESILRRVPLGQTITQYYYGVKDVIWNKRTGHEMETLAQALDALREEGIQPGQSLAFEILIRRFAALHTSDQTGNYAIADALSFSGHSISLLPTTTLSAINKTLKLMKPQAVSNSGGASGRSRSRDRNRNRPFSSLYNYNYDDDLDDSLSVSVPNSSSHQSRDNGRRMFNNYNSGFSNQSRGGVSYGGRGSFQGRRNYNSYDNNYNSNNQSNRAPPASAADGSARQ